MDYDDPARRLTVLSGLTLGAVLGAGLALLAGPARRLGVLPRVSPLPRRLRRLRRGAARMGDALRRGLQRLEE